MDSLELELEKAFVGARIQPPVLMMERQVLLTTNLSFRPPFIYIYTHAFIYLVYVWKKACVQVRVGVLLPTYRFQGLDSVLHTWQQAS